MHRDKAQAAHPAALAMTPNSGEPPVPDVQTGGLVKYHQPAQ
jgi:hypothetical protein